MVRAELPAEQAVHLGGPAEYVCERVVPALAPLTAEGLRVRITLGLADDLLADLAAGRLDVVISTIRPRLRGVVAEPLYDEEFVLVAAPSLEVRGELPGALADVPLIAYAEDLPIVRRYWRTLFGRRPSASAQVVIPDLRGVRNAVLAGMGVSVLPTYLCEHDLAAGRLVALAEPEIPPINTGYLAVRPGGLATTAVSHVHTHLREALKVS
ncbi:substrate-binding domain-containing protein [Nonomuraea sp. SBT364]|uniref:substrate-binding domain-containing protein n=1 Tax=Nonomuraea sp. SBT364 TaxID=1580530 RepID=UPI003FA5F73A